MTIVVFGSINMDLVVRTPRLPAPGETLTGHSFFTAPGGKGANQAVACARLDAPTRMVGRVGDDLFGEQLRHSLRSFGVQDDGVLTTPGPSGVALIAVDDAAENTIVIVPGANGAVGSEDMPRLERALDGARALLLQLETPLATVAAAARAGRARGATVILDPAPALPLPDELYALADILTPNESEATTLTGIPVHDEQSAAAAARALRARGARTVIIKLGARGALAADANGVRFWPAFTVTAVDTVAAGDAFNGGLAVALSEGRPFEEAIRWGLAAGALSVTKHGAQPSMPDRAELLALSGVRG
ncbi:ribokinase [Roseiflexus castenholzii]|uniref:Ribokinase n=1 Tax=Roseiflexus castenholzii (strain DSM 13941 / HLO8) TaxID=383372 RepID=A7NQF8_ROSCS|nr:ribokinase [Roseiflexus castenholzii]ABU59804.1 ribokinase [Roseiflexus castenholzii DSM 13941]